MPAKTSTPIVVLTFVAPDGGEAIAKNGAGTGGGIPHGFGVGVGVASDASGEDGGAPPPPHAASSEATNTRNHACFIAS
jgi:hypothetical protein